DPVVRNDLLDFALEVEWFDRHLGEMIDILVRAGELENTIIVVTSDNGMPFPSAKATLREYGTHVPLVVSAGAIFDGNRVEHSMVSLIDLAPTFLEIACMESFDFIHGKSLLPLLRGDKRYRHREFVLTGRERHSHARPDNVGYPSRAIRTERHLYIWNLEPERWPAGNPSEDPGDSLPELDGMTVSGFYDVDDSPSKRVLATERLDYKKYYYLAFSKRPVEELYDIILDPGCTVNLASDPCYDTIRNSMRCRLINELTLQKDPRLLGSGNVFEAYPRFGTMRNFPGFKEREMYNPAYIPVPNREVPAVDRSLLAIPFKQIGDVTLKLYLIEPENRVTQEPSPAIIFFHGGGFVKGSADHFKPQAEYFAARGMTAVLAEYRIKKLHGTTPYEAVKDAKSAIRYLREHAGEWSIDPSKIIAAGGSAGGHLAAATALIEDMEEPGEDLRISSVPDALVLFNPALHNGPEGSVNDLFGVGYRMASPFHHIRPGLPPSIVFHGTDDEVVPAWIVREFCEKMNALGNRCELHLYENQTHGFFNRGRSSEYFQKTLYEADLFLVSLGFLEGPPSNQSMLNDSE
ncbi:MAG TPA: hypothetical protein ENO05_02855, partial [Bacteroides sp.]|nr:hypothetical protein [Bacteroides sp.]